MLFTIHCTFAPGAFANAKQLRLEHYAFLQEVRNSIVEGGFMILFLKIRTHSKFVSLTRSSRKGDTPGTVNICRQA